jgi:signal transduction histidine kinase
MNPHTITPPVTKMSIYRAPSNLFKSLTRAKIASTPLKTTLISSRIAPDQPAHFAAALAHEVRNPLSNINLAVEMLKSTVMDADQQLYLNIIMRSSGRVSDLVTDLLGSSQSDVMKPEKYSVHQLLDEVLAMTKDRISLKNITVRKDYTTLDCKILVNKQKIKIALTNIIINAIDAMPSKKGQLQLVTRSMNSTCIIEIKDNGIGISKENLEKIFQPYFTDKKDGMGLGLSTTLEILQANHATVDVRSEEGRGTGFALTFTRVRQSGKC